MTEMKDIVGSGGKGGGGQTFREDENTLRSNVIVSTIEAWGEGPIVGPVNGLRSIFLDTTPLQNQDGTLNFGGKVGATIRFGDPVQDPVPGFESTSDAVAVNVEVTNASPLTRTVSSADVSVVGLTIALQSGLYEQDTKTNVMKAASVELAVDVKLSSSPFWVKQRSIKYSDKTTSPYQETFRIKRPSGTGVWQFRVRRISPDNASATMRTNTHVAYFTELQDLDVTYPNVAYAALSLDAAAVNSTQIPVRSAEIYGLIVQVPSNLDVKTRKFTGLWNGTFKNDWTNDPAWVLYDICTNDRYGLGLPEEMVDRYSFYDASVYNSQLITVTNKAGTSSEIPRFSFNYQIADGQVGVELLNRVASVMNAKVMWVGGRITVLQDRPAQAAHIFNKSNVIDGKFTYRGTPLQQRNTVVNVTWNDPESKYQQKVTSVEDAEAIDKYGYNPIDIAAYGCTNESQAIMFGRNYLYTVLRQTDSVVFKAGREGQLVLPHEIIKIFDADYTGTSSAGRLAAGSTTTVLKLDRAVTLSGASTIDIRSSNGTLYTDKVISTVGTTDTITLAAALPAAPGEYSTFIIKTGGVEARQFRVSRIVAEDDGTFSIEANAYDPTKYSFIETGVALQPPVFTSIRSTVVPSPVDLTFTEQSVFVDNVSQRKLIVSWLKPLDAQTGFTTNALISKFQLVYRINGGAPVTVRDLVKTNYEMDVTSGIVEVKVFAISYKDVMSLPLTGSYTLSTTTSTEYNAALKEPNSLGVRAIGGYTFNDKTLNIQFTAGNPYVSGGFKPHAVKDFAVFVYSSSGGTLLRTETVPSVEPGQVQYYTYDFDKNVADGGPRRSVYVRVHARDVNNRLSQNYASATFTNPAPSTLSNVLLTGAIGSNKLVWDKPSDTDYSGVLIYRSTTSGFTPGAGNLVADITGNYHSDGALQPGTTYYYKLAAYDTFEKSGLNFTTELSATVKSQPGIPQGSTNPVGGTEGDLFFNTTDGKLYRYHNGAWTAAVPTVDLVGTIDTNQLSNNAVTVAKFASGITPVEIVATLPTTGNFTGRVVYLSSDGKMYRYTGSAWTAAVPAVDVTGQLTDAQLAAISAAKLTGQITSTQITDGAISTPKLSAGAVTANEIAANTITAAEIAAGAITASELAAGSVTTTKLAANAVTANELAANSVIAGKIAAGAISATEIAAGAITTKQLAITDPTNLIPNGSFINDNLDNWVVTAGFDSVTLSGAPTHYVMSIQPAAGTTSAYATETYFDCRAGDEFVFNVAARIGTGTFTSNTLRMIPYFILNDGTSAAGASFYFNPTQSWQTFTTSFAAPANATGIRFRIFRNVSTDTSVAYLTSMEGRRKNAGQLIVDGSITGNHIAANTITGSKIAADTITSGNIAANSITSAELAADSVIAGKIAASAVTSAEIAAGTIVASNIAANTITGDRIAASTITGAKIAADTITAANIAAGAITASELAAGSVTAGKIAAGTITATEIAANAITASELAAGSVTTAKIAAGAITAASGIIADLAVTTLKIAGQAVTTDRLTDNAATAPAIATGSTTVNCTTSGTTLQTLAVTSTGGTIAIDFGCMYKSLATAAVGPNSDGWPPLVTLTLSVRRNGTQIFSSGAMLPSYFYDGGTIYTGYVATRLPPVYDTPAAGTYTYTVVGIASSSEGIATYARNLSIVEFKK
jgi:predicted phage tail protein